MQLSLYKTTTPYFLFVLFIFPFFLSGCSSDEYPMEDARLIVTDAADSLLKDKDKRFLYHESMPKEQLMDYLVLPITYEYLTQYFAPEEKLDSLFHPGILEELTAQIKHYHMISFDDELFKGIATITPSEIPGYVKEGFRPPAPDEDYAVSSVYVFATPLIYHERAVLFFRTYGSAAMNVLFCTKDEEWKNVSSSSFYRPSS